MRMRVWIDRIHCTITNHGMYFTDLIIYYHIKESHAKDIEIDKDMLQQDWREPRAPRVRWTLWQRGVLKPDWAR